MKKRVLIADDSSSVRAGLGKLLLAQGYDVRMACNGKEALSILARDKIHIFLLDLEMPELDGWQLLEELEGSHPETDIIVITGQPGEHVWARSHGAHASFEKPLEPPVLLACLQELTGSPETRRGPEREVPRFRYSPPARLKFESVRES